MATRRPRRSSILKSHCSNVENGSGEIFAGGSGGAGSELTRNLRRINRVSFSHTNQVKEFEKSNSSTEGSLSKTSDFNQTMCGDAMDMSISVLEETPKRDPQRRLSNRLGSQTMIQNAEMSFEEATPPPSKVNPMSTTKLQSSQSFNVASGSGEIHTGGNGGAGAGAELNPNFRQVIITEGTTSKTSNFNQTMSGDGMDMSIYIPEDNHSLKRDPQRRRSNRLGSQTMIQNSEMSFDETTLAHSEVNPLGTTKLQPSLCSNVEIHVGGSEGTGLKQTRNLRRVSRVSFSQTNQVKEFEKSNSSTEGSLSKSGDFNQTMCGDAVDMSIYVPEDNHSSKKDPQRRRSNKLGSQTMMENAEMSFDESISSHSEVNPTGMTESQPSLCSNVEIHVGGSQGAGSEQTRNLHRVDRVSLSHLNQVKEFEKSNSSTVGSSSKTSGFNQNQTMCGDGKDMSIFVDSPKKDPQRRRSNRLGSQTMIQDAEMSFDEATPPPSKVNPTVTTKLQPSYSFNVDSGSGEIHAGGNRGAGAEQNPKVRQVNISEGSTSKTINFNQTVCGDGMDMSIYVPEDNHSPKKDLQRRRSNRLASQTVIQNAEMSFDETIPPAHSEVNPLGMTKLLSALPAESPEPMEMRFHKPSRTSLRDPFKKAKRPKKVEKLPEVNFAALKTPKRNAIPKRLPKEAEVDAEQKSACPPPSQLKSTQCQTSPSLFVCKAVSPKKVSKDVGTQSELDSPVLPLPVKNVMVNSSTMTSPPTSAKVRDPDPGYFGSAHPQITIATATNQKEPLNAVSKGPPKEAKVDAEPKSTCPPPTQLKSTLNQTSPSIFVCKAVTPKKVSKDVEIQSELDSPELPLPAKNVMVNSSTMASPPNYAKVRNPDPEYLESTHSQITIPTNQKESLNAIPKHPPKEAEVDVEQKSTCPPPSQLKSTLRQTSPSLFVSPKEVLKDIGIQLELPSSVSPAPVKNVIVNSSRMTSPPASAKVDPDPEYLTSPSLSICKEVSPEEVLKDIGIQFELDSSESPAPVENVIVNSSTMTSPPACAKDDPDPNYLTSPSPSLFVCKEVTPKEVSTDVGIQFELESSVLPSPVKNVIVNSSRMTSPPAFAKVRNPDPEYLDSAHSQITITTNQKEPVNETGVQGKGTEDCIVQISSSRPGTSKNATLIIAKIEAYLAHCHKLNVFEQCDFRYSLGPELVKLSDEEYSYITDKYAEFLNVKYIEALDIKRSMLKDRDERRKERAAGLPSRFFNARMDCVKTLMK